MNTNKILIVDDEQDIIELIAYNLKKNGFEVEIAMDGFEAVVKAKAFHPDLILLDRMMPGKDGIETLKDIRKIHSLDHTIILFLTALGDETSEIEGLSNGADDYLSKPIKMELLIARIRHALRKSIKKENSESNEKVLEFGKLKIHLDNYIVVVNEIEISLAKKEFELLALLTSKPERVFLRQEILSKVWGDEVIVGDRTIDVHIRKIRQKLDLDIIKTVKGVGYKFVFPD